MPKLNGQTQDIETTTDLAQNDSPKHTSQPSTDTETTCEPMPEPPLRQSDTPSTLEINNPTTENIPQNDPSHSRGSTYNLRPNANPNYSEIYRYRRVQNFNSAHFATFLFFALDFFNFFAHTIQIFSFFGGTYIYRYIN